MTDVPLLSTDIRRYLNDVADALPPHGPQHVVIMVGGSLLTGHGLRDSTRDVVSVHRMDDELKAAVAAVAGMHGLASEGEWRLTSVGIPSGLAFDRGAGQARSGADSYQGRYAMGIRRLASGLAAGAVLAAGLVGLSAPAQALPSSTWQITVDCAHDVYLPGNPGDTYDFTLTGDCLSASDYSYLWNEAYNDDTDQYLHNGFLGVPANSGSLDYYTCSDNCGVADPSDWYFYAATAPETAVGVRLLSTNQVGEKLTPGAIVGNLYTSVTGTGWDIYWVGVEGTPPPSWYQSVGRASADATCEAGWSASWAQWPNGGTGGWVCNREQYYNTATGSWAYRVAKK